MPAGTMTGKSRRKRRSRNRRAPWPIRFFQLLIKMMISPVLLLWDSFRREETPDKTWLYSFFLFTTLIMLLTGAGIFFTQGPMWQTARMMAAATASREIVPGDIQAEIALINKYALQKNLDPLLIYAIIKTKSNFQARAVSPAGAKGLMQIMPRAWRENSASLCSGEHGPKASCHAADCIFQPEANIRAGTAYFQKLLRHYHQRVDLALEAYNAGLSNVRPGSNEPRYQAKGSFAQALARGRIVSTWQSLRREALDRRLRLVLQLEEGVKILMGICLFCWLALFWWAGRKLFRS